MLKCNIEFKNVFKWIEFGMFLPDMSLPVEWVFWIMRNVWSAQRERLSTSVVWELLNIKANYELFYVDFYDKIKSDKMFLSKILSSEKYNVCPGKNQESYEKLGERTGSSK